MSHFLRRQGWVAGLFALFVALFIITKLIQPAYGSNDFGSLARADVGILADIPSSPAGAP